MKNTFRINDWNGDEWSELMVINTDADEKVIIELKTLADKLWNEDSETDDEEPSDLIEQYADWNEIFVALLKKNNIIFNKLDITILNC